MTGNRGRMGQIAAVGAVGYYGFTTIGGANIKSVEKSIFNIEKKKLLQSLTDFTAVFC